MVKATVGYLGSTGEWVPVAHDTPLPTTGDGGGSGGGAVDSVNGQTGTVVLDAADVGALPDTYTTSDSDVADLMADRASLTFKATEPSFRRVVQVPSGAVEADVRAIIDAAPWGSTVVLPDHGINMGSTPLILDKSLTISGSRGDGQGGASSSGSRLTFTTGSGIQVKHENTIIENIMIAGQSRTSGSGTVGLEVIGAAPTQNDSVGEIVFRNVSVWGFEAGLRIGEYAHHIRSYDCAYGANIRGVTVADANYNDIHFYGCSITNSTEVNFYLELNAGLGNLTFVSGHMGFSPRMIYQDPASTSGGLLGATIIGTPCENIEIQHINVHQIGSLNVIGGYWSRRNVTATPGGAVSFASNSAGPVYINTRFQGQGGGTFYPYVVEARASAQRPVQVIGSIGNGFADTIVSPNLAALTSYLGGSIPSLANHGTRNPFTNTFGYPMVCYISGGAFNSNTTIGGHGTPSNVTDTGQTTGTFIVPHGASIRVDFQTANPPTWAWTQAW